MEKEQIIHTMGMGNCGGRCLLHLHVQDGQIRRISTEPADPHAAETPLTACARGIHYHQTFFRDRLTTPMKRVGKRGEGKFVPISWEEAVDTIASEWVRIRDQYGPASGMFIMRPVRRLFSVGRDWQNGCWHWTADFWIFIIPTRPLVFPM